MNIDFEDKGKTMPTGRIVIIPFLHGKLAADGQLIEPDIDSILEKWLPFAINLLTNLIFTPIQFGMRNLPLAALDILIVWATIIWMMIAIWKHHKWVAVAQVPYFVWVSIATVLQLSITWMNW